MTLESAVNAVVVNYNGGEDILTCLRNLTDLSALSGPIMVVDNGSTDGSVDAVKAQFPDVDVIELGENLGPAAARNLGLKKSASRQVLLIDDDVFLDPQSLGHLLDCATSTGAIVCVPRLVLVPEDVIQADGADVHFVGSMHLRNSRRAYSGLLSERQETGTFSSSCMLVNRAALLEAGGFDEKFFIYQEDMELGLRLRSFGHLLLCEPAAIALHARGSGTPALSYRDFGQYPRRRAFLTMRNRLRMILLHYRIRTLVILFPALMLFELASVAFAIRNGFFTAWLSAWHWQWKNRDELRRRRQWIQSARQVEDAALLIGGELPLAPGVADVGWSRRLVNALSNVLDFYWQHMNRYL